MELPGTAGVVAAGGGSVAVALSAAGSVTLGGGGGGGPARGFAIRGEPGALLVALDAKTGAIRWAMAFDATTLAQIAAIAPAPDGGFVVGGSFEGTLRAGEPAAHAAAAPSPAAAARPATDSVVSTAGRGDGFVARVSASGALMWLVRVGGPGADAVQGVAIAGDRVAIAGTFAAGAELAGVPLPPYDDRSPLGDAFAAELDAATGARRWSVAFGGKEDDSVAGVAIDATGRVAVAANLRGSIRAGDAVLRARGASDGLVAWLSPTGQWGKTAVLGGADFDGLRGIAAAGDRVVVGGFFSGSLQLGSAALAAGGGDDAFIAQVTAAGAVERAWQIGGGGREEIAELAAVPGGFVAGVEHTAELIVDGAHVGDAIKGGVGAALIVRAAP